MTFFAALLAGAFGTWLARASAHTFGIVARPNPIVPQHRQPVAYLGGIGIAIGLLAASAFDDERGALARAAFAVPAAGYLALGLVDDLRPLNAGTKLLAQTALAVVATAMRGGTHAAGWWPVDAALSIGWIVLVTNAVNVTDVCDGLVGGLAAISLGMIGFGMPEYRALAWGGAGACLGFLAFNRPPASIYLGDAGSLLLGYTLSAATLPLFERQPPGLSRVQALAAAAPFLFETGLLMWSRARHRLPWWRGSAHHFSLRMQAAGWSKWHTDFVSWAVAGAICAAALGSSKGGAWALWVFVLVIPLAALLSGRWLLLHDVDEQPCTAESDEGALAVRRCSER